MKPRPCPPLPARYRIQVEGVLDQRWSGWLNDMEITVENSEAIPPIMTLTGLLADQAALRGLLNKLWDLNLTVVLVQRLGPPELETSGLTQTQPFFTTEAD